MKADCSESESESESECSAVSECSAYFDYMS